MLKNSRRLFIAINIPESVRNELAALNSFLKHPAVRWTPRQNLHITVHFIGQTELNELALIAGKISATADKTPPFSMTMENIKVIRKGKNPVMIWAALKENEIFSDLALRFHQELSGDGSRKPNPHITLARIKEGKGLEIPALPEIRKISFDVRNIELMESANRPSGPVYNVAGSFNLKG